MNWFIDAPGGRLDPPSRQSAARARPGAPQPVASRYFFFAGVLAGTVSFATGPTGFVVAFKGAGVFVGETTFPPALSVGRAAVAGGAAIVTVVLGFTSAFVIAALAAEAGAWLEFVMSSWKP
jgi:hypothetical protein